MLIIETFRFDAANKFPRAPLSPASSCRELSCKQKRLTLRSAAILPCRTQNIVRPMACPDQTSHRWSGRFFLGDKSLIAPTYLHQEFACQTLANADVTERKIHVAWMRCTYEQMEALYSVQVRHFWCALHMKKGGAYRTPPRSYVCSA